ncbi:MAG: hypothetical protein K2H43_05695 [Clostridia bacterium]|nr:hypothetical protein [Clostridia bacterium]
MLDERTGVLLSAINGYCEKGSFKIVEEGELLGHFSPLSGVDRDCLRAMLNYLVDHKYVEVGYAEEGEYCLRPLPEGRLYFERKNRERKEGIRRRIDAVLCAVAGGFSGGFLGSLAAWLIAARV